MSIKSKRAELLNQPWRSFTDFTERAEDEIMRNSNTQRCLDKMMPIVAYFENGHFVAIATCQTPDCGKETRFTATSMPSPSILFTKIRNRDWQVSKKRVTCPLCLKRRKQKPVVEFKREPPMKPIAEALAKANEISLPATSLPSKPLVTRIAEGEFQVPQTDIAPTDKAKAAKRNAYALLLDHYDELNKRYQGEWSDKKIAELSKLSESAVAKIREDDFGPAGPPPQFIDLKERISKLEATLRTKEQQVLAAMDSIPTLQSELATIRSQFDSLVQAHGWSE